VTASAFVNCFARTQRQSNDVGRAVEGGLPGRPDFIGVFSAGDDEPYIGRNPPRLAFGEHLGNLAAEPTSGALFIIRLWLPATYRARPLIS
jgi:hypothetical protein